MCILEVSWDEVNAAFGQTGFLLDCLVQAVLKIYNALLIYEPPTFQEKHNETIQCSETVSSNQKEHNINISSSSPHISLPQLTTIIDYRIIPRGSFSVVLSRVRKLLTIFISFSKTRFCIGR